MSEEAKMNSFLLFDVCVRHEGNKLKGSLVIFMTLNPDKRPHSSIWQLHIRPDFLSEKQPSRQNLLVYQKKLLFVLQVEYIERM